MEFEIISRADAINKGLSHYFTGKQCKRGHLSKRNTKNRYCLECVRINAKPYDSIIGKRFYEKHKDRLLENKRTYKAEWYKQNAERLREKAKVNGSLYKKNNPDKHCAAQAKRRASKLMATPTWLSKEQKKQILIEYKLAKWCSDVMNTKYHVDHIIPLKSKDVCGLHVPWNLQVIPAKVNILKGNKIVV